MKLKLAHLIILALLVFLTFFIIKDTDNINKSTQTSDETIKYVAVGDSYTIGLGIEEKDRWPNVLTRHLKERGVKIELIANPAVSGFTVGDAIEAELPVLESVNPDFVTVLIGANDNFMKKDKSDYRVDLVKFLDGVETTLSNPKNIILVTIPDYSKSPALKGSDEDDLSEFIESYNGVIKEEAVKRGLLVADIFSVSQTMIGDDDYILDGLHPSAKGYRKWEEVILPVVFDLLRR